MGIVMEAGDLNPHCRRPLESGGRIAIRPALTKPRPLRYQSAPSAISAAMYGNRTRVGRRDSPGLGVVAWLRHVLVITSSSRRMTTTCPLSRGTRAGQQAEGER